MKAILVIDVPDDFDAKKIKIGGDGNIYYARDDERASIIGNIRNIKPMPKKLEHSEIFTLNLMNTGYNTCIDEILGELNVDI